MYQSESSHIEWDLTLNKTDKTGLAGLGYHWASSLLGFVALAMVPFREFL
jgi:hypothetical protein